MEQLIPHEPEPVVAPTTKRGPRRPWYAYIVTFGTRITCIRAHSADDAYERTVKDLDVKPRRDETFVRFARPRDIEVLDSVGGRAEARKAWERLARIQDEAWIPPS